MTSRELLDELKAGEELLARGYKRQTCETCKGTKEDPQFPGYASSCTVCNGVGWKWLAPITK